MTDVSDEAVEAAVITTYGVDSWAPRSTAIHGRPAPTKEHLAREGSTTRAACDRTIWLHGKGPRLIDMNDPKQVAEVCRTCLRIATKRAARIAEGSGA